MPRREATSLSRPGGIAGVDRRDSWNCGRDERLGLREGVVNSFSGGKSESSAARLSVKFFSWKGHAIQSNIQTPATARLAALTTGRRRHHGSKKIKRLDKKGKL